MATVVVIGGGTAGATAARALRGRLPGKHRVVLVERSAELSYQPAYLWLMVGRRRLPDITRRTDRMRAAGAEVLRGQVSVVETGSKTVRLKDGRVLRYDQLVLAAGADVTQADTRELAAAGHNLYTPEGALGIQNTLQRFEGGEVVIVVTSTPYKCPQAVFEAASLLHEWFREKGMRDRVNISVHIPERSMLVQAGPRMGRVFKEKLETQRITLHTGQRFVNVDPDKRLVRFASGHVPYDLLIYVPRHRAPEFAAASGLLDEHGWIPVDPFTLETRHEDIYAVGDINRVPLPSGYDLPKAGIFASLEARVLAQNLHRKLDGKCPDRFFGGKAICMVETGSAAFPFLGNFYTDEPRFIPLGESRLLLGGKWLMEKLWLREHS